MPSVVSSILASIFTSRLFSRAVSKAASKASLVAFSVPPLTVNRSIPWFKTLALTGFVFITQSIILPIAYAGHDDGHFIIGYINHPRVNDFYRPVIKRAYEQIGITVTFEKVGGKRGLKLLNEGMTDADVIRYDAVTKDNPNVIAIEPQLSRGASFLLCIKGAECSIDILSDPTLGIAVTTRFFHNIEQQPNKFSANFYEFDDFYHVVQLIKSGRFDYAIAPSDYTESNIFDDYGFTHIPLVEHKLVHVINKKHLHLKDKLSDAIATQLKIHQTRQANEM
jgi:hypothetical protein